MRDSKRSAGRCLNLGSWLCRNEIVHTNKERTVIYQDVRADPTLPRTKDVSCPKCSHNEAVFFSASTEEGMTLFFNCCKCGNRWRDYV
jgi:DNA-directed RNA polymerase II subunit RPB9